MIFEVRWFMKNILNDRDRAKIESRIERLTPQSDRLWGKMTVGQMLCHVTDQIRMAVGKIPARFVGNAFTKTIGKYMVLAGFQMPKGRIMSVRELNQDKDGTPPKDFENDRGDLLQTLRGFGEDFGPARSRPHPAFGEMSRKQWGRLILLHLDHHLRQFGV